MALRLLVVLCLIWPGAMRAASDADIRAYATYAARFDARQGRPEIAPETGHAIAGCVLADFEDRHGRAGVARLMELMRTVSSGVEFDDPTVVGFTETYGDTYGAIVNRCRDRHLNG